MFKLDFSSPNKKIAALAYAALIPDKDIVVTDIRNGAPLQLKKDIPYFIALNIMEKFAPTGQTTWKGNEAQLKRVQREQEETISFILFQKDRQLSIVLSPADYAKIKPYIKQVKSWVRNREDLFKSIKQEAGKPEAPKPAEPQLEEIAEPRPEEAASKKPRPEKITLGDVKKDPDALLEKLREKAKRGVFSDKLYHGLNATELYYFAVAYFYKKESPKKVRNLLEKAKERTEAPRLFEMLGKLEKKLPPIEKGITLEEAKKEVKEAIQTGSEREASALVEKYSKKLSERDDLQLRAFYDNLISSEKTQKIPRPEVSTKTDTVMIDSDIGTTVESDTDEIKKQRVRGLEGNVQAYHGIMKEVKSLPNSDDYLITLVANEDDAGVKFLAKENDVGYPIDRIEEYNNKEFPQKFNRVYYLQKLGRPKDGIEYTVSRFSEDAEGPTGLSFESFAADSIIFGITGQNVTHILLIQRKGSNAWALPGGMIDPLPGGNSESSKQAAERELGEETGLDPSKVQWLATSLGPKSAKDRLKSDPRFIGTTAYVGFVRANSSNQFPELTPQPEEVETVEWVPLKKVGELSFKFGDHKEMIIAALKRLGKAQEDEEKAISMKKAATLLRRCCLNTMDSKTLATHLRSALSQLGH